MIKSHDIPVGHDTSDYIVRRCNRQGIKAVPGKFLFGFIDSIRLIETYDLGNHALFQVRSGSIGAIANASRRESADEFIMGFNCYRTVGFPTTGSGLGTVRRSIE